MTPPHSSTNSSRSRLRLRTPSPIHSPTAQQFPQSPSQQHFPHSQSQSQSQSQFQHPSHGQQSQPPPAQPQSPRTPRSPQERDRLLSTFGGHFGGPGTLESQGEALLHFGDEVRVKAMSTWRKFANWALQDNVLEVAVGLILASSFTAVVTSLTSDIILPVVSLIPFLSRNLEEKFTVLRRGMGGPLKGTGGGCCGDTSGSGSSSSSSSTGDNGKFLSDDPLFAAFLADESATSRLFKAATSSSSSNEPPRDGWHYNTVEQALADGAVVLAWGSFVDKVFRFLIIGSSLYLIARLYSWMTRDDIVKYAVKCPFCGKNISKKARRCGFCTTWLDGRDGPVRS